MKRVLNYSVIFIVPVLFLAVEAFTQVTVSGYVRTMTGVPIEGATVTLVNLNQTRKTDANGYYDFSVTDIHHSKDNAGFSLVYRGRRLLLNLEHREKVSITVFNLSGKLIHTVLNRPLQAGNHSVELSTSGNLSQQLYLARIQVGNNTSYYKITMLQGNLIGFSEAYSGVTGHTQLSMSSVSAEDSIVVTHPNYNGGLDLINTRRIDETTGIQNFRMFSTDTSDTGWWASEMLFNFEPYHEGVDYYKNIIGDWVAAERQCQREIEQCFYRYPSEVPESKKWETYKVNCNANIGGVASTGGNTCNISPSYCNRKSWWEIEGVHHHEMCHSYQQFYNHSGVSGFGESIPDAVRCLSGFFHWPKGTTCRGGINQAYQGGARYWFFIELKHPGFIYELMSSGSSGDIATKVQDITGESLDDLCEECETEGMPYTLGRGRY